jgi:hypothetical protein
MDTKGEKKYCGATGNKNQTLLLSLDSLLSLAVGSQPIQVENQIERSECKPAMSVSSLVFSGEARARMRGCMTLALFFSGRRYNYAIMWDFPQKTPIDLLKKL